MGERIKTIKQKQTNTTDFSKNIKAFYAKMPVVAVVCNKNFTIRWKNKEAKTWASDSLRELFKFPSDEKAKMFSEIQEKKEVHLSKIISLSAYGLRCMAIDENQFLVEVTKQEHPHPYWFDKPENALLSSLIDNARNWASRSISSLFPIKTTLECAEEYDSIKHEVVNVFKNNMKILKFIDSYADYMEIINSDKKGAICWDVGRELKEMCKVIMAETLYVSDAEFSFDSVAKIPNKKIICKINPWEFRKAILQLVSNAFKFSVPGNEITVKAFEQKDKFYISVSDKGTGISMRSFKKVGTPFYSYNPLVEEADGAGVGLAYVKAFVQKYNGEESSFILGSKDTKGTTVTISLPIEVGAKANELQDKKTPTSNYLQGSCSIYKIYLSDIYCNKNEICI